MELWIRSQDKEKLIKVDEVCIEEILETTVFITNKYNTGEWLIECKDTILGVYKTKERALEVLDEIQNIIIGKYMTNLSFEASFSKFDDEEATRKTLIAMAVYEMPKE